MAKIIKPMWSTFIFILFNICTLSLFWIIWIWRYVNFFNRFPRYKTYRVLAILLFSFYAWGIFFQVQIASVFSKSRFIYKQDIIDFLQIASGLLIFSSLFMCACALLTFILSLISKCDFEKLLVNMGIQKKVSYILCFIFPFYYQYYIIYNTTNKCFNKKESNIEESTPINTININENDSNASKINIEDRLKTLDILLKKGKITPEAYLNEREALTQQLEHNSGGIAKTLTTAMTAAAGSILGTAVQSVAKNIQKQIKHQPTNEDILDESPLDEEYEEEEIEDDEGDDDEEE